MPVIGTIFYVFLGIVAIGSALGMLINRNAIYAALFLVLNFATIAVLYLALGAPFIALTQIIVYAGAIMVLFLFVNQLKAIGLSRLGWLWFFLLSWHCFTSFAIRQPDPFRFSRQNLAARRILGW